jgi:hypothetical protein
MRGDRQEQNSCNAEGGVELEEKPRKEDEQE